MASALEILSTDPRIDVRHTKRSFPHDPWREIHEARICLRNSDTENLIEVSVWWPSVRRETRTGLRVRDFDLEKTVRHLKGILERAGNRVTGPVVLEK
jgi:hypothetical protein